MSIYPTSADMNAKSNRLGPNNGSTDNAGPVPMTFRNANEEKNSRESLVDKARNKAREYDVGERNKGYLGKDEHTAWAKSMFPSMEQPEIDQHYNDHARDGTGRINIDNLDISSIEHHYLPDKEVARGYDIDNNGYLDNSEFQSLMEAETTLSDKEIEKSRKFNDSNNSGGIGIDDEYGTVANSSDSPVDQSSSDTLGRESLVDKARSKAREYDVGERNKGYLGKDEHTAWAKSMFPSMKPAEIDQHYNDHARDGTGRININKLDISSIEHHYLPDKEVARDYDIDNDGHLNNGEFQSLMKDNTTLSDKEIDYLRKSNDSNNSGEIGIDDEYGAVANSSDSQVDNPSGESLLDKARSKAREYDVGERNKGYLGKEEHTKWAESMFPSMEQAEIDKHYNDHARDGTGRINIEKLDISSIEHHYEP